MGTRYWYHPESDCYFQTKSDEEAKDVAMECVEVSLKEFKERRGTDD